MFQRYAYELQSKRHYGARNWARRVAFAGNMLTQLIHFWSHPVQTTDVDLSTLSCTGEMINLVESRVLTEIDVMDFIVLSTCDVCCTIQLLCHLLSPLHFPLQLPAYKPCSLLDQGYMSDEASRGLYILHRQYLPVVVHQVHCLWVDH